ncbi:hypothetical protein SADUNF_Sadunf14G0081300 [Salix dunnii]|uniref:Amine oxidase domain-containing protein n=1 Tax=Salix dunnii TaxID=1413687 RepID=A0A835JDH1_9ROSI|nr:hypothetical protein SADUNF_Sadunf14G0081300 [Salix dunnii]
MKAVEEIFEVTDKEDEQLLEATEELSLDLVKKDEDLGEMDDSLARVSYISSFKVNGEAQSSAGHSATADYVIVGGGISGLCIAQALATNHRDVTPNVIVTESRDCVGGHITTLERDVISGKRPPTVSTLPINLQLISFCYSMLSMIWDFWSSFISDLVEFVSRADFGALGLRPPLPVCSPFNVKRLPTPKGQIVGSFRKGLAMLPYAIATSYLSCFFEDFLDLISRVLILEGWVAMLSLKLSSIIKLENGVYSCGRVIKILLPTSCSSVHFIPKRSNKTRMLIIDGALKGFGPLHPRRQGVETLESELVEAVDCDLRKMLINPNATDPLVLGVRVWPQAIPQFLSGHAARDALKEKGLQGLFLGGNYVSDVTLGRFVEGASELMILEIERGGANSSMPLTTVSGSVVNLISTKAPSIGT